MLQILQVADSSINHEKPFIVKGQNGEEKKIEYASINIWADELE